MTFNADIKQFRTPADLATYLEGLPRPGWVTGSCYHNTYRPTEAQWAGLATMKSMRADYVARGWTSGPHFYLAVGSPNPANDGIWMMTPPTSPGTHAGPCNSARFGIEVVGDFQTRAPSLPQQQLLIDTLVVLHRWAGLGPSLMAHRDCMPGRTCPGNAFYGIKPQLIAQLTARLAQAGAYFVRHTQAIFEAPAPDARVALNDAAELIAGTEILIDEVKNGWCHLTDARGFVPVGVLSKL